MRRLTRDGSGGPVDVDGRPRRSVPAAAALALQVPMRRVRCDEQYLCARISTNGGVGPGQPKGGSRRWI